MTKIEWRYCPQTKELLLTLKPVTQEQLSKIITVFNEKTKNVEGEYDLNSNKPS